MRHPENFQGDTGRAVMAVKGPAFALLQVLGVVLKGEARYVRRRRSHWSNSAH